MHLKPMHLKPMHLKPMHLKLMHLTLQPFSRNRLTITLALSLSAVTTAVAQMSHTPPGSAPQPPIDACALLSRQTATTLYGAPVTAPKPTGPSGAGMFVCIFTDAKGHEAVTVLVQRLPSGMEHTYMDAMLKGNPGHPATPVSGLGDSAAYTTDGSAIMLSALKQGKLIMVGLSGPDTPSRRAALLPILRDIVSKV